MSEKFEIEKLNRINSVSPSFCLAKWLQVTIDLVNGTTHSCHHPPRHRIPLEELKNDPGALHNTRFKKEQRKKMLLGDRPSECSYCWDMEDLGNQYSDRYIKSTDPWAWHAFDKVKKMDWQDDINPTYVEVMIDNLCNFSCAYCISDISTGVAAEIKKFGAYPVSDAHHRLPLFGGTRETSQPFVDAFEKWLPKILPDLKVLRVTGGEPLLSPSFWSLLEKLAAGPKTPLEFAVNTHLCHRPEVINKFCATLRKLQADEKIESIELYVSLDTHGPKAEYIRHGLNYQLALDNLSRLFELLPETRVVIMCTFNILTFGGFDAFIDDIIQLKTKHNLVLDVSNLKNPHYLRADMADEELTQSLSQALNKLKNNANFFNAHEISKVENLLTWTQALTEDSKLIRLRSDFYRFILEYDKRKNRKFLEIFPEYANFFQTCKQAGLIVESER